MGRIFIHDLEVIFILSCKGQKISKANQLGVGSHFYGTEHEIWADFGPVGNTEKKIGGPIKSMI